MRLRGVLQLGLMEGALEAAARSEFFGGEAEAEIGFCAKCEMPILAGAAFCNACGAATNNADAVLVSAVETQSVDAGAPPTTSVTDGGES